MPRPDGKPDDLGLLVLDEPSVKQSDPTVMSLWLSEDSKQHGTPEVCKKDTQKIHLHTEVQVVGHAFQTLAFSDITSQDYGFFGLRSPARLLL